MMRSYLPAAAAVAAMALLSVTSVLNYQAQACARAAPGLSFFVIDPFLKSLLRMIFFLKQSFFSMFQVMNQVRLWVNTLMI